MATNMKIPNSLNDITSEFILVSVPCTEDDFKKRCCCNCGHDIRIPRKDMPELVDHNECDLDGHYIGYVDCFENWCRHWKPDKFEREERNKSAKS